MAKSNKFGTFGGVFTPSILTILGVIMYMRLPMIIGQAGLWATIGIIVIAHIISITTGLSVSSIATDKKVKAGGTYYIISRSLGLPIGGTLGLALFVGLSFSVSLYLIGFAESFLGFWGFPINIDNIRIAGSIILLTVTIITFISTSLAIKAQYLIMAAILLSLISIFFGNHDLAPATPNLFGHGSTVPLMVLFGIFFPAVTGFEAGVSMSGDLKDPKKSIPGGTIAAISIGLVVYIILAFFFSYTVNSEVLSNDPNVLLRIALVPQLVVAGIWGATLSSALGSILAAPRILQATALDKITPKFFAKGTGPGNEPKNAILLTFVIAEAGILIGDLDIIARIVSIFFITTYGFLNMSAAFEAATSADFRPSFRTPVWVSVIGALACILVMIQLDFLALVGAIIILGALFLYLKSRELSLEGGDAWGSVWASLVKTGIQRLSKSQVHARNWRPNIIMFSGSESDRQHLVKMGDSLAGTLGIVTGFELEVANDAQLAKHYRSTTREVNHKELTFYKHPCSDIYSGMDEIVRVYGFTGVEPNTVFMGWAKKQEKKAQFEKLIKIIEKNGIASIFLNYNHKTGFGNNKTIDFWWKGHGRDLAFAINIIRHLTSSSEWKDAKVRILMVINHKAFIEKAHTSLNEIIKKYRVTLEIKIINNSVDAYPWAEIVKRESFETDLTILGIPEKIQDKFENIYNEVNLLSQNLSSLLLIKASPIFEAYDPGIDVLQKESRNVFNSLVVLPDLSQTKYPVINDDISKIDINGRKELETFFDKALIPGYTETHHFFNEFSSQVENLAENLNKLLKFTDMHRRGQAIVKAKNEFYYHAKRGLENLLNEKLTIQKHALEEGILWYLGRLDEDILKFPRRLNVNYEKADFKIQKEDNPNTRWFKTRKRIFHPFTKKTIPVNIRYKMVAGYYLKSTRYYFLEAFLNKFFYELEQIYAHLRPLIISIDEELEIFEKKIKDKRFSKDEIKIFEASVLEKISAIEAEISGLEELNRNRLMVEYRNNLQLLIKDFERVDINRIVSKKRQGNKFDKAIVQKINSFTELWYSDSLSSFNKIYLDLLMQAYKNRIADKINEFEGIFIQEIESGIMKKLETIKSNLNSIDEDHAGIQGLKLSIPAVEAYFQFVSEFEEITTEFRKLESELPESITLAEIITDIEKPGNKTDREEVVLPLRKITTYIIETKFISPVSDLLGKTLESLKGNIYLLKDNLSLTRFSLENINSETEDRTQLIHQIKNETLVKLTKVKEKIAGLKLGLIPAMNKELNETFEILSSYRIKETVDQYSRFSIDYQGKVVKNKFKISYLYVSKFIERKSAGLLYSKTEGILFAKKFITEKDESSKNEKILDLMDTVTPNPEVIKQLPHYYKNLFSGKSSIVDDFWINRPIEEAHFEKAIRRFRSGITGGIMLLGERNSGKTALCRFVAKSHFKEDKIHNIFPLPGGSIIADDFKSQLQKSTNLTSEINEIFENLPYGSVIIINDLELWWERSEKGLDVIKLIFELIGKFDYKCLFIINMNPFTYELINGMYSMESHFVSIIKCRPFNSEEIKELVLRRHRSSGLKFRLDQKDEEDFSEITNAKLFNKYFDISEGNPGTVLYQWLCNIKKVSSGITHLKVPRNIDIQPLDNLDDNELVILVQLALHKRLPYKKLEKMLNIESHMSDEIVNSLVQTGIVEERPERLLLINPYLEPFIRSVLKRKGLV